MFSSKPWLALIVVWICGCDRLDMYDQARFEADEETGWFSDGRSSRPAVVGTVARGQLKQDRLFYFGEQADGQVSERFPFKLSESDLDRGQQRYEIYCAPCHGLTGHADGMVVQRGFTRPPSFYEAVIRKKPVGHYFQVITSGYGAMPPYNDSLSEGDRWRVVAWLRILQLSEQRAEGLPQWLQAKRRKELP